MKALNLSSSVDFLRAERNEKLDAMVVTMKTWDGSETRVDPRIKNSIWAVYTGQSGQLVLVRQVEAGDMMDVADEVVGDEFVVILRHQ